MKFLLIKIACTLRLFQKEYSDVAFSGLFGNIKTQNGLIYIVPWTIKDLGKQTEVSVKTKIGTNSFKNKAYNIHLKNKIPVN